MKLQWQRKYSIVLVLSAFALALLLSGIVNPEGIQNALFPDSHPASEDELGINGSSTSSELSETLPKVYYFYSDECGYCIEKRYIIDELAQAYSGEAEFIMQEIHYNSASKESYVDFAERFRLPQEQWVVPIAYVGENAVVGVEIAENDGLKNAIEECISLNCTDAKLAFAS